MFSGLREGSIFYILQKGEKPTLKVGQVVSKSEPRSKNITNPNPYGFAQVVDISVKADGETYNFDALDTNASVCTYPEKNVFITDSREQMLMEVENMLRNSTQILDSVDFHRNVVNSCNVMLCELNPQLAKEKEQEEKISALQEKITGVEGTLSNIQDMLAKALNNSNRKSNNA